MYEKQQATGTSRQQAPNTTQRSPGRRTATSKLPSSTKPSGAPRHSSTAGTSPPLDPDHLRQSFADAVVPPTDGDSKTPLDGRMRSAAESSLGFGLGQVNVHQGPTAKTRAGEHDALAVTIGNDIFLGDRVGNSKNPVMAHEVAHVAQQKDAATTTQAKKRSEVLSKSLHAEEQEADAAASAFLLGKPAKVTSTTLQVAPFAPATHRQATADGLVQGGFTADEIGMIYASNWERDFSQAIPEMATAVIAWKQCKLSSIKRGGNPSPDAARNFQHAASILVQMPVTKLLGESYSGYFAHEHMDNPGGGAELGADWRWGSTRNGLPGYICDGVAYIKDEMVAAVNAYRTDQQLGKIEGIDNWKGVTKPDGYEPDKIAKAAKSGDSSPAKLPSDVVAEEAQNMAKRPGTKIDGKTPEEIKMWKEIAHHLGRAMHSFEDFWAHSNWVELAMKMKKQRPGEREKVHNHQLKTGVFDIPAKLHALGHKLSAMSGAFLADFDLMLRVYNRTKESTKLNNDADTRADVMDPLENKSWTPHGEAVDLVDSADEMETAIDEKGYKMEDFMCNRGVITAIHAKAQSLIEMADDKSDEDSHGKLAKDQDEGDKNHSGAAAIATKANELVFGPLKGIMKEQKAAKAKAAIEKQLALVDQMVAAPSESHPLWKYLEGPKGDFPEPGGGSRMG